MQPGADGMATLGAQLSADEAAEAYAVIDQLARLAKADGDGRAIAVLRTELFSLLLRCPGGHAQPAVAAYLAITAHLDSLDRVGSRAGPATAGGVRAGSVDGLVITAGHARELLARIGALGLRAPDGGSLTFAVTDGEGRLLATTTTVAELLRVATAGCPDHPDGQECGCAVLGAPADTGRYAPTGRQQAFVTTRDRT